MKKKLSKTYETGAIFKSLLHFLVHETSAPSGFFLKFIFLFPLHQVFFPDFDRAEWINKVYFKTAFFLACRKP